MFEKIKSVLSAIVDKQHKVLVDSHTQAIRQANVRNEEASIGLIVALNQTKQQGNRI